MYLNLKNLNLLIANLSNKTKINANIFNKNKNRMDEFKKLNTNRTIYQQINYKKINSNIVFSKKYTKFNKSLDKLNNESRNGIVIRKNTENKELKFKTRNKISINKNRLIFPSFTFKNII